MAHIFTADELDAEAKELAERLMAGDFEAAKTLTLYETAVNLMRNYTGGDRLVRGWATAERQSGYRKAITTAQAAAILNTYVRNFRTWRSSADVPELPQAFERSTTCS